MHHVTVQAAQNVNEYAACARIAFTNFQGLCEGGGGAMWRNLRYGTCDRFTEAGKVGSCTMVPPPSLGVL